MRLAGKTRFLVVGVTALALSSPIAAADGEWALMADASTPTSSTLSQLNIPPVRARMSADLALQTYEANYRRQAQDLGEYQDVTVIEADLPQTAQKGRYRLQRVFSAPKSMAFKAIDFAGDNFVKTNVIARLLQSEVDHTQKGETQTTAITPENYKFSYKGVDQIAGQPVHVFQVKPRQKRPGLFKGKVYLDVYTGMMRRSEGQMVKSPSFFVKKIEFTQDYAQVNGFNLVSHVHSTAQARIVGKTVVDITHSDYQARSMAQVQTPASQHNPSVQNVSLPVGNFR